jgi:hypothetical protein
MLKKSASGSSARRAGLRGRRDTQALIPSVSPFSPISHTVVPDLQAIEVYCAEMVFPQPAREKTSQDIAKRCQSWYNSDPVPI